MFRSVCLRVCCLSVCPVKNWALSRIAKPDSNIEVKKKKSGCVPDSGQAVLLTTFPFLSYLICCFLIWSKLEYSKDWEYAGSGHMFHLHLRTEASGSLINTALGHAHRLVIYINTHSGYGYTASRTVPTVQPGCVCQCEVPVHVSFCSFVIWILFSFSLGCCLVCDYICGRMLRKEIRSEIIQYIQFMA